ncbi:MAG: FliH/SctL family protein [Roseburia sp.]|nr:FliH/SctL family protein [Roseburia sp.]
MSSNLLKLRNCDVQQGNARIIDSNALAAQRIEALSMDILRGAENIEEALPDTAGEEDTEDEGAGFQSLQSNIIKAPDPEELGRKALEEANALLADAQTKADKITEEALRERERVLEEARQEGYEEGCARARQELEKEMSGLREKEKQLEAEYDALVAKLEPELVEHITNIYEYVFHVDMSGNREILEYLITSAMSRAETSRNFLVHISREDYPYVSTRRQQLLGAASGDASIEIIEDMTLSRNECMIETENGIIDCGLGTELAELSRKLKLLSYQSR